jgi:hypothetical protein
MIRFIKTTAKIIIVQSFLVFPVLAKPIGVIKSVVGKTFVFSDGKVFEGSPGMVLQDYSSLSTELGGQITIADYHDRFYHLSGSGNLTFMKNLIELKSGYLWVQAPRESFDTVLKTSNAQVLFNNGEALISYDPSSEKTQVLAISGHFDLANIENSILSERIQAGMFSFVDKDYENGRPRKSTPIGKQSYLKIVSLFNGIEPIEKNLLLGGKITSYKNSYKNKESGRSLASISVPRPKDGSNAGKKIMEKELNKLNKFKKIRHLPTHLVKINIFWPQVNNLTLTSNTSDSVKRSPASISSKAINPLDDGFKKDFIDQYKNQKKHDSDLNSLINELDSYKEDFNINY